MKVGDYVRTEYGITQFKEYETTNGEKLLCIPVKDGSQGIFANVEDIIKSSPNIIDLIEEGDYINGLKVEKNKYGELYTSYVYYGGEIGRTGEVYTTWLEEYKDNEDYIDSILTKEQFESMEYKVK